MKLRHYLFNFIESLNAWRRQHDLCEVCNENPVETRCYEGCGKRICENCESYYYTDATICVECRDQITPEQETEERQEVITSLAEDCICEVKEGFNGEKNLIINSTCDLSEEEHDAIAEYKRSQVTSE